MAPASVQMVLLQGENADGPTVDENEFTVVASDDAPTVSASDRVIAAIVSTREDAVGAGLELSSIGVAWTDELEAAALRDALADHKIENVLLVSAFLAATALTQSVGGSMGYGQTAMLFVEPGTATLSVVETTDGSVIDVHEEQLDTSSEDLCTELAAMVARLDELPTPPDGLLLLGSGVDISAIIPCLAKKTSLIVNSPEEPETALARGAALASANVLASPTSVLAYAQDRGTGAIEVPSRPEYLSINDPELGEDEVAYSAVDDEEASAETVVIDGVDEDEPPARRGLLVGSGLTVAAITAVLALEVALSIGMRTTVGLLPAPIHDFFAPVQQVIAPALGPAAVTKQITPKPLGSPVGVPPAAAPGVPTPGGAVVPIIPVPLVVPPIAPGPGAPVQLPNSPASPPGSANSPQAAQPGDQPPSNVPPQNSPPQQGSPGQDSPSQGSPGGTPGNGNPGNGPGPGQGPWPGHGYPGNGGPGNGGPPGSGPGNGGPGHGYPRQRRTRQRWTSRQRTRQRWTSSRRTRQWKPRQRPRRWPRKSRQRRTRQWWTSRQRTRQRWTSSRRTRPRKSRQRRTGKRYAARRWCATQR